MAFQDCPKMSLHAQYDDLCRYTTVLTKSCEEEFKMFIEGQLNYFRLYKDKESEVEKLKGKFSSLEFENRRLETQIKLLKDLLKEATEKRKQIESERNSLEVQIQLIKEVLLADGVMDNQTKEKLKFLNSSKPSLVSPTRLETIKESAGSLLSLSEVDGTLDDLMTMTRRSASRSRQSRRRSSSESRLSHKKRRPENRDVEPTNNQNGGINMLQEDARNRSNSEPVSTSPESVSISRPVHRSDSPQYKTFPYDLRRCHTIAYSEGSPGRYSSGGKLSRQHVFAAKVLCRPEKCNQCRQSIGFFTQALKCQDCAIVCHLDCKDKCPLPCIPLVHTPNEGTTGVISDYTPSTTPMIPPLIVHCVNEIENRGLKEKGLYRVNGREREIKLLKEKLLNGRTVPPLYKYDINVVCGTVKEFLRSLSEPLITRNAWQEFANAADLSDDSESLKTIYDIVCTLPPSNRDTLAFLILHLQRIAGSPDCKMPISNLAKIFGPTIIGYSVPAPVGMNVVKEVKNQCKVMEQLLLIPSDLWQNLLNIEPEVFTSNSTKTPENTPAPKLTRLGPLHPPGQKGKGVNFNRTPATGRNPIYSRSEKTKFTSPLMK